VANGFSRQTGFDITVASEIMAILCLSRDLSDLERRLGNIIVAYTRERAPITARDLGADGAMTVLLRDALMPNLVQTLDHTPAFVHGGPFANIAHGCSSLIATDTALRLADYVVTEAGFGADLGAEKFLDIKCRKGDLTPSAVVLVATVRALKMSGGVEKGDLGTPDADAVTRGCANLGRHLENLAQFGVPVAVAINHFTADTEDELDAIRTYVAERGARAILCRHWADGGAGAAELAEHVADLCEGGATLTPLYPDDMPLAQKIETIAKRIYRADGVEISARIRAQLAEWEQAGHENLPICMAKTQYSFTTDPTRRGAPTGFTIPVREVRLSAGAGFVVAICGDIMTMPGLPRHPAAESIAIGADGHITGLF
jgi:formate--tetrahydrofolate ligase